MIPKPSWVHARSDPATTHDRDAGRSSRHHLRRPRDIEPPYRQNRYPRRPRDLGQALAADLGAVAGLARRFECRTGNGIVDDIRINRLGFSHGVERDADETLGSQQGTACGRVAARSQVNTIAAAGLRQSRVAMERQACAVSSHHRQQRQHQRDLILLGKVLFSHADPAAARCKDCSHQIHERQAGLMPVGDEQQRRVRQLHER